MIEEVEKTMYRRAEFVLYLLNELDVSSIDGSTHRVWGDLFAEFTKRMLTSGLIWIVDALREWLASGGVTHAGGGGVCVCRQCHDDVIVEVSVGDSRHDDGTTNRKSRM